MDTSQSQHNTSSPVVKLRAVEEAAPGPSLMQTTSCVVAELDRLREAAMDAFNAAEEKLLADPRPEGAQRFGLERERDEARDRWDGLRYAMTIPIAESKPGLWAQLAELDSAIDGMFGAEGQDEAARILATFRKGLEAVLQDEDRAAR
jgi:hypothetical protein